MENSKFDNMIVLNSISIHCHQPSLVLGLLESLRLPRLRVFFIFVSTSWCWMLVLRIDITKYRIIPIRKKSHSLLIKGLLSLKVSGANSSFFCFSSDSMREFWREGIHSWNFFSTSSTVYFRKRVMINSIWM